MAEKCSLTVEVFVTNSFVERCFNGRGMVKTGSMESVDSSVEEVLVLNDTA